MFLYEARARLIQEHHQHSWALFWALSVKLERTGFSKPQRKQGNKDITMKKPFSCTFQSGVSAGLGWAWLALDSWVGKRGSGQARTCRQALNIYYPQGPCGYMAYTWALSRYIGTTLGPKYIPYTYMDPLG